MTYQGKDSFNGKLAVVTGGGSGIGRELVVQLASEGCSVAVCDLNESALGKTASRALAVARRGAKVTTHVCDVADEASVERFRDEVVARHGTGHVDVLFNNAGIDGYVSFVAGERALWERTFGVCWGGTYICSRVFLPLLAASADGCLVNTSSVNGFRAGFRDYPNTAYSTAKFAVKGFSEALIEDFRLNAPNVKVALVMPGGVVTGLSSNSSRVLGTDRDGPSGHNTARRLVVEGLGESVLQRMSDAYEKLFRTPAAEAVRIILDGVRAGQWRILVGDDAHELDEAVRADPAAAYNTDRYRGIANRDACVALLTLAGAFDSCAAQDLDAEYELRVRTRTITCRVRRGALEFDRGPATNPVAVLATQPADLRRLVERPGSFDEAVRRGALSVSGDLESVRRLFAAIAQTGAEDANPGSLKLAMRLEQRFGGQPAAVHGREPVPMESFRGKLAVVTGGGTGMGRELVVQLAAEGCSVAMCDVDDVAITETAARAVASAPRGTQITTHVCDVSDEASVQRFRTGVIAQHRTDHIDLLFNNAGVVAETSFVTSNRATWERVFATCWDGVYFCSRAFVPLLVASEGGWLVNTSSIQGFWVDGPGSPHTAYATAKFAVKGFSEALIEDFRLHAPHVRVAVVLPGHIDTEIVSNSARILGENLSRADPDQIRVGMMRRGLLPLSACDTDLPRIDAARRELAPEFLTTSPRSAARAILDGIRAGCWRILVGADAHRLDNAVRANPGKAYDVDSDIPAHYLGWFAPMVLLRAMFDSQGGSGLAATYEIRDGDERITVRVVAGQLEIARGRTNAPDAIIETDPLTFGALLTTEESLPVALRRGGVKITGNVESVERLLAAALPSTSRALPRH
jgi:NAD(P)-dependent dehydrogenase (short-subunit alcohol dehydrogenase family)